MFTRTLVSTTRVLARSQSPFPLLFRFPTASPISIRNMASSASAMAKRLQGKTILITGASSGIGRSCAFEFARTAPRDLRLVLTARRIDALKAIAAQIREEVGEGVKVLPVQLDVSDAAQVKGFVNSLPEEWRGVDVLVNNA